MFLPSLGIEFTGPVRGPLSNRLLLGSARLEHIGTGAGGDGRRRTACGEVEGAGEYRPRTGPSTEIGLHLPITGPQGPV